MTMTPEEQAKMEALELSQLTLQQTVNTLLSSLFPGAVLQEPRELHDGDEWWSCTKCKTNLGVYNRKVDEMRIRRRDLLVFIQPGTGGTLRMVCPGCGNIEALQDERG